jgi:hypothetical protein
MNSRERVIRAVEIRGPDRVPITHATLPGAYARYGAALDELYQQYPSDVVSVGEATSGEFGEQIGVPSRDTWGSQWVRYTDEHKGQVVNGPLSDWDALASFEPPDTSSEPIMAQIAARLEANVDARYTLADGDILWQRMFYLHGYQAILEDLLLYPDRCAQLRDLILSVMIRRVERLCQLSELDGIAWRTFFKPA